MLPVQQSIGRHIFETVRHPDVVDAGGAQFPAHIGRDFPRTLARLYPIIPHLPAPGGQGKPVRHHGMREEGGVEIQAVSVCLRPLDPAAEILRGQLVAGRRGFGLGIHAVKIDAMPAGRKAKSHIHVGPQLVAVAGGSRILSGDQVLAGHVAHVLKPFNIVALPAVQG